MSLKLVSYFMLQQSLDVNAAMYMSVGEISTMPDCYFPRESSMQNRVK